MADVNLAVFPVGEVIANRYELKSVVKPNNGEAAVYICDYDSWGCLAKVYEPGKEPGEEKIELIKSIDSQYIVKKLDRVTYQDRFCEIMPFFNKADLISSGNPVNDKIILGTIIPNISNALKAIHDKGLVHGNVRPTNIFYSSFGFDVLIGDFGVDASNIGDCGKHIDFGFLPPEMLKGEFDAKGDWWSLGISLANLIKGRDLFEGLNKKKALKKAATLELDLPEKASPILKNIILGLTVKDSATRWGYDEIQKALAGEEVPIVDEYVYEAPNKNYTFAGTEYVELEDVAAAFADNWSDAITKVNDPDLLAVVENYAEDKYDDVSACMAMSVVNSNMALHKLIKILNPQLPACWMGLKFENAQDFVEQMLNAPNKSLFGNALASKILSSVAETTGSDENVVSKIKNIEAGVGFGTDFDMVAHKLAYVVSDNYVYNFRNVDCSDVNALIDYMKNNVAELDEICDEFINDTKFFAWLEVLGYGEQIDEWKASTNQ